VSPDGKDKWADWLLHGRQRGLDKRQLARLNRHLQRLRDRVLRGARLKQGHHVLDVGAGTGLIATGACGRVGGTGHVIALDVSRDALLTARATADNAGFANLQCLLADGHCLPFPDETFDAAFTRSVLIYLPAKQTAIQELYRVLRPGGRVSLFEPINSAASDYVVDLEAAHVGQSDRALTRERQRVLRHLQKTSPAHVASFVAFDERALVRWFVKAGFRSIRMSYELAYQRSNREGGPGGLSLRQRPNPGTLSYEEAAREVLGDAADDHLESLQKSLRAEPVAQLGAVVYLTARR
jgi:ubiquinone/menaquinone biosynthesis C-methylase UbiE